MGYGYRIPRSAPRVGGLAARAIARASGGVVTPVQMTGQVGCEVDRAEKTLDALAEQGDFKNGVVDRKVATRLPLTRIIHPGVEKK